MSPVRLEAFSDGVLAVIITIMVLEMKAPHGVDFSAIRPLLPVFLAYVLSFAHIAIYWNNHHHLLRATKRINGRIMWANMLLLFWLSLVPFCTAWMGENGGGAWPTALYGVDLLMSAISYTILQSAIVTHHGKTSELAQALGRDLKGKLSVASYLLAIIAANYYPIVSYALYTAVALMWIIPDRRVGKVVSE